jgi:16S rRNA (cytidine1402-2'-O)-methyltransferase
VGALHLVATPIGNLEDVTLRALRVLAEADLLLAEDTRRTRILLQRHGVKARPLSLHAHNEASRIARVLEVLDAGGSVALVSDAGTPILSDPGARLVDAALRAGPSASAFWASCPGARGHATPCWPPCASGRRRWCSSNRRAVCPRRCGSWPRPWAIAPPAWPASSPSCTKSWCATR